jgi:hypothetical protein
MTLRMPGAMLAALLVCPCLTAGEPPYPPSQAARTIDWNYKSHLQHGLGSDQWPLTWADDDNVYTSWGDGWGWNKKGPKRSMGVTRLSGMPPDLRAEDLWGVGPGAGVAKPEALIAFDRKIYLFWTMGRSKDDKTHTGLALSSDYGATWTLGKEKFLPQAPDGFRVRGIAQYGKGGQGAPDEFVYVYFGFSRLRRSTWQRFRGPPSRTPDATSGSRAALPAGPGGMPGSSGSSPPSPTPTATSGTSGSRICRASAATS